LGIFEARNREIVVEPLECRANRIRLMADGQGYICHTVCVQSFDMSLEKTFSSEFEQYFGLAIGGPKPSPHTRGEDDGGQGSGSGFLHG
jgi:hypothetical protein